MGCAELPGGRKKGIMEGGIVTKKAVLRIGGDAKIRPASAADVLLPGKGKRTGKRGERLNEKAGESEILERIVKPNGKKELRATCHLGASESSRCGKEKADRELEKSAGGTGAGRLNGGERSGRTQAGFVKRGGAHQKKERGGSGRGQRTRRKNHVTV